MDVPLLQNHKTPPLHHEKWGRYCLLHITLSARVNKSFPTPAEDYRKLFSCQEFWMRAPNGVCPSHCSWEACAQRVVPVLRASSGNSPGRTRRSLSSPFALTSSPLSLHVQGQRALFPPFLCCKSIGMRGAAFPGYQMEYQKTEYRAVALASCPL